MFDDSDTIDDFLFPTETTTGRQLGKFRPKARAKTVKVVSASTKTLDVAHGASASLEPVALDSHSEIETERPHLQPCTSSGSIMTCQNGSTTETVPQRKVTQTESGASQGKHADNFQLNKENLCQLNKENLCQDENTSLSLNTSNDDPLQLTEVMFNDLDSVDDFLCPMETTKGQQLGKFRPKVRAKTAKVVSASTKTSDDAQRVVSAPLESIAYDAHSELQIDTTCFQSCMSSCSTVSGQHRSMPESVQQPEVMRTELVAPQDKHAESCQLNEANLYQDENTSLTLSASDDVPLKTVEVGKVSKFKPKVTKLPSKKATVKSVSFILPDASCSAPVESISAMDTSSIQATIHSPADNPLHTSDTASDWNGEHQVDYARIGEENNGENELQRVPESIDVMSEFQFIEEPNPQNLKRTTSENDTNAGATKSTRKLRKRTVKSKAGKLEGSIDGDCGAGVDESQSNDGQEDENMPKPKRASKKRKGQTTEDPKPAKRGKKVSSTATSENDTNAGATKSTRKLRKRTVKSKAGKLEGSIDGDCGAGVDESQSNDGQEDENMPKPKRASRKRKGQTTEDPKPAKRGKKVSSTADSSVEESSKKKFPHATRRKRRQVNKILLQTPEEEIDRRQICIKDLIMLAEAKERISTKEPTATGNLFSNQSSLDDNGLFGDDEEMSRCGGAKSYPNEPTTKKLNYHSYSNRLPTVRWSKAETQLLYEAIRQFGSDFEMIQQLFPNRTRHQIKLKFKIEERKHPLQVRDALFHRSEDFSHVMQVIKIVQEKAETSAKEETNDDQENASPCNVDTNEKEAEGIVDEGDDYGGKYEDAGYPDFDEHEWDSCTYRREKEEDSIWDF
ncbi:uncharacterized protein LOC121977057 isoform X1 [Zingiber officinale]|uniref:uncharacterized protein LOC121977057 isoform X1 n=1 Tax=Zingiber officinale TaxID=94328 RepID=UPI001C4A9F9B|nr:uncharacterized protein LOC121977057 isoform X1 [Zingiber officinale]XP_042385491.1 uncharacterized protein LOC121977057 isoform X1 [Zingiber officinale]XP_042385492.1 uncharacterized protein LOC121977057 isoform X1 [Zingiber officinale]